jgi:hypothetical protein
MKIVTTTHKIMSSAQAAAALEELARENNIDGLNYDESAAGQLSEFDAMKWRTLCDQRSVLLERESSHEGRNWKVPSKFLCIYEAKAYAQPSRLENTESLSEIAA